MSISTAVTIVFFVFDVILAGVAWKWGIAPLLRINRAVRSVYDQLQAIPTEAYVQRFEDISKLFLADDYLAPVWAEYRKTLVRSVDDGEERLFSAIDAGAFFRPSEIMKTARRNLSFIFVLSLILTLFVGIVPVQAATAKSGKVVVTVPNITLYVGDSQNNSTLPEHEEKYELHRLLGALLSQNLTAKEKLDIIGNEYAIPIEKDFREDVSVMCNLSQKIKETGIEIGKREMILSMHRKGYTTAQIADVAGITEKQVEDIIKLELQLV